MPRRLGPRTSLPCSLAIVLSAGLAGAGPAHAATQPQQWTTYHADPSRGGEDTADSAFGRVGAAWATSPLDGAMYAQPLLDGNTVIVATENDSLYGIDATHGTVL